MGFTSVFIFVLQVFMKPQVSLKDSNDKNNFVVSDSRFAIQPQVEL
jgi:hypothetical protein